MALLVVPFNNAMRLGQGFNSYTQSLCLDKAVSFGVPGAAAAEAPDVDVTKLPQIVTYSSHFVDKLSDVVKALNVSAALSVKVGTVTGSGSGSYIDEDKIKESDINFIVQVKVTNETTKMPGEALFNAIEGLDRSKFTDVYGDTFISGFLEGGEFMGLVSIKVHDSTKVQDIKAQLEISFSAVQAKGAGSYLDQNITKDAETSISVNWSGGGQIKDPNAKWDMDTMLRVAAQFPDLVAKCPQRTSAILTKYANLTSFLKIASKFDTLSYDNAGVYTADLLDDYMDYKVHWKNVRLMHDDLASYVKSKDKDAYEPTVAGLDLARREILKNMVGIVGEVDAVRANPNIAVESILKDKVVYINPPVFASRLPVKAPPPPPPVAPVVPVVAPPLAPQKPDPKAWQWALVPGKDSGGGDIMQVADNLSPQELMMKVYEWEKANPGKYVKCFNMWGYLKHTVNKTATFVNTPVGRDLYVRVLVDDQWAFVPNCDCPGNDFAVPGFTVGNDASDIDIIESLKIGNARNDVISFNSWGWVKNRATLPPSNCDVLRGPGKAHQGVWIKKSAVKL